MTAPPDGSVVESRTRRTLVALPLGAVAVVAVGAEAAVLIGGSRLVGPGGLLLVLVASAAWVMLARDERVERRPRLVALAVGVAFAIAIAVPPRTSRDLWSYVMYGRTVSVHHASPYTHAPIDYPLDLFFGRVGVGWRHARSVYGPLFTGLSAGLTRVIGTSALGARLAFQGLAALAAGTALLLVWRTTHSARAVAFLGLHPAVVIAVVNGGHNDALVGLAILAGALLAARARWFGAGFVLGLGILVKASAGLGLLGIIAWAVARDRRAAARVLLTAAATTFVGYLPVGAAAVRAATHAGNGNTRASVWDPISSLLHPSTTLALVGALLLAVGAALRLHRTSSPAIPTVAATAAYLVGGAYVLPWYPVWALPSAALERNTLLAGLVAIHATFLVAVYELELPAHPTLTGVASVVRSGVIQLGAWTALAVFVVFVLARRRTA